MLFFIADTLRLTSLISLLSRDLCCLFSGAEKTLLPWILSNFSLFQMRRVRDSGPCFFVMARSRIQTFFKTTTVSCLGWQMRTQEADTGQWAGHSPTLRGEFCSLLSLALSNGVCKFEALSRCLRTKTQCHHQESSSAYRQSSNSLWKKDWTVTGIIAFKGSQNY